MTVSYVMTSILVIRTVPLINQLAVSDGYTRHDEMAVSYVMTSILVIRKKQL